MVKGWQRVPSDPRLAKETKVAKSTKFRDLGDLDPGVKSSLGVVLDQNCQSYLVNLLKVPLPLLCTQVTYKSKQNMFLVFKSTGPTVCPLSHYWSLPPHQTQTKACNGTLAHQSPVDTELLTLAKCTLFRIAS